jgi:hypothetical protein
VRQQQAYLQDLNVVVEGERDQLKGMVDKLEKEVEGLRGVKEEAASHKGKAMQQAQALEKATAAITKAEYEIRRLKANKEKPKAQVEGGEGEGEEEATASTATIYRRAEGLKDSILGVAGKSMGTFGRVWEVAMRNKNVVDAFSKARLKQYHNEADVRDSELVDRIRDLVQWAKAHHKTTHGRQVYETLCTAVADCRKKEDGGCVGWVMKRLDIGAQAMGSGIGRRKVMDESFFWEGNVFNDDRADFKTKNQQFPAEARLQQNFWVSCASRTSPNSGDVVFHHLGSEEEEGRPTHKMTEMVEPGKTDGEEAGMHPRHEGLDGRDGHGVGSGAAVSPEGGDVLENESATQGDE